MRTIPNIKDNPKNEDNLKIEDFLKNEDNTREFSFLKGLPTAVVFVALRHFKVCFNLRVVFIFMLS